MLTAIETTATIGANRQLFLDDDLPEMVSAKVRVVGLYEEKPIDGSKKRRKAGSAEGLI